MLLRNSGGIDRDDFELLLMALGHHLTPKEIDTCLQDMGIDANNGGKIAFPLFFDWWTDSMGMQAIRKKTAVPASRGHGHK